MGNPEVAGFRRKLHNACSGGSQRHRSTEALQHSAKKCFLAGALRRPPFRWLAAGRLRRHFPELRNEETWSGPCTCAASCLCSERQKSEKKAWNQQKSWRSALSIPRHPAESVCKPTSNLTKHEITNSSPPASHARGSNRSTCSRSVLDRTLTLLNRTPSSMHCMHYR